MKIEKVKNGYAVMCHDGKTFEEVFVGTYEECLDIGAQRVRSLFENNADMMAVLERLRDK